jgi:hypothetical protein
MPPIRVGRPPANHPKKQTLGCPEAPSDTLAQANLPQGKWPAQRAASPSSMTGVLPCPGENQTLIIREEAQKIVCVNSAGKENFMGFSVHNDGNIGRDNAVCSVNLFFNF